MRILRFYTTQTDLAKAIKYVIDNYLANEIKDEEMIESIQELVTLNPKIFYKDESSKIVNSKIKTVLGVKRLSLIDNVLNQGKVGA